MNKNISIEVLEKAIADKDRLEALCFCLKIKGMFGSGALIKRNYSDLQRVMRISYRKLSRCIKNALKFSYMREEGGLYITNPINRGLCVKIQLNDVKEPNSMFKIQRELEKAIIAIHVRRVNYVAHNFKEARGKVKSLRQYKKRKNYEKVLSRCGVTKKSFVTGRVSYIRLAQIANITRNRAIELVNEMTTEGSLVKELYFEEVNYFDEQKGENSFLTNGYLRRFFCPIKNSFSLFVQLSNKYRNNPKRYSTCLFK